MFTDFSKNNSTRIRVHTSIRGNSPFLGILLCERRARLLAPSARIPHLPSSTDPWTVAPRHDTTLPLELSTPIMLTPPSEGMAQCSLDSTAFASLAHRIVFRYKIGALRRSLLNISPTLSSHRISSKPSSNVEEGFRVYLYAAKGTSTTIRGRRGCYSRSRRCR
jgi:hypothetical protein